VAIADSSLVTPRKGGAGVIMLLTMAGVACGLTLLWLGMRSMMEIGGECADGPSLVVRPCPEGVPRVMVGGFAGAVLCAAINLRQGVKHKIPSLIVLALPALFLSLGYNFLDLGLHPPNDGEIPEVWWLLGAGAFALLGGIPLLAIVVGVIKAAPMPAPGNISIQHLDPGSLWKTASGPVPADSDSDYEDDPFDKPNLVEELNQLAALHKSGALTDEEFESAKRRLLNGNEAGR
jgi:hypothetical protein